MSKQLELPTYTVERSKDFPKFLIVYCPRKDCPGTAGDRPFLVAEREWRRPQRLNNERTGRELRITGRACPYCFRSARIPSGRTDG